LDHPIDKLSRRAIIAERVSLLDRLAYLPTRKQNLGSKSSGTFLRMVDSAPFRLTSYEILFFKKNQMGICLKCPAKRPGFENGNVNRIMV